MNCKLFTYLFISLCFTLSLSAQTDDTIWERTMKNAADKYNQNLSLILKAMSEVELDEDTEIANYSDLSGNFNSLLKDKPHLKVLVDQLAKTEEIIQPLLNKVDELKVAITNEGGLYLFQGEYKGDSYEVRKERYKSVGFTKFIDTDKERLEAKPVDKRNKDITQRLLVDEKRGDALQKLLDETHKQLLKQIDDLSTLEIEGLEYTTEAIQELKQDLNLELTDKKLYKEAGKESWASYVFGYMPVAACYPLFRKIQNDAESSVKQIYLFFYKAVQK